MLTVIVIYVLLFELVMFGLSVWFIVFGIRSWNISRRLSALFFVVGFTGMVIVANTLNTIGFL